MRILCIGDSNTWGYNPVNGQRHENRWTKMLSKMMPENDIIEEGLNGRTILSIDPIFPERQGIASLKMLLMSHKPVDLVIIMLGTNELKNIFPCNAEYIADGIRQFIDIIKNPDMWQRFSVPEILIISPVLVREELITNGDVFGDMDERSVTESKKLAKVIAEVCKESSVEFMNAAQYAVASVVDNIHMDEDNHKKLAEAILRKVKTIKL
ncbi:MAG: GDSL family lipase [Lachnospira sp.]|nr:GDSL family lipase [Lachnospira sp.]